MRTLKRKIVSVILVFTLLMAVIVPIFPVKVHAEPAVIAPIITTNSLDEANKRDAYSAILSENRSETTNLFNMIAFLIFILIFYVMMINIRDQKEYYNYYRDNKFCIVEGKKILRDRDISYFREIPCNGDIYKIYWIAKSFGLGIPSKGFIGANILKWINEGKAKIVKKEDELLLYINRFETDNFIEKELQRIILDIADDQYLEVKDLRNKMKSNKNAKKWYEQVFFSERDRLIEENYLVKKEKLIVSEQVYQDISEIIGLIKFLKTETLISEKKSIDVFLWGEYVMIAQMFGFADSLEKEYEGLYKLIDF